MDTKRHKIMALLCRGAVWIRGLGFGDEAVSIEFMLRALRIWDLTLDLGPVL